MGFTCILCDFRGLFQNDLLSQSLNLRILKLGSWIFSAVVSTELKSCYMWVQNLDLGQIWCCDTDKLDGMIVVLMLVS